MTLQPKVSLIPLVTTGNCVPGPIAVMPKGTVNLKSPGRPIRQKLVDREPFCGIHQIGSFHPDVRAAFIPGIHPAETVAVKSSLVFDPNASISVSVGEGLGETHRQVPRPDFVLPELQFNFFRN